MGVRKEKLEGCVPLLTSLSPYSYLLEGNDGFGIPGPKTLPDGTYQPLLFLQPEILGCTRSRRTDGQVPPALQFPAPWRLGPLPRRKPQGKRNGAFVAGGLKVELSLKLLSSALYPCLPASLLPQPSSSAPNDPLPWGDS